MNEWQPIETYPNDIGVRMLMINGVALPGAPRAWPVVRVSADP